MLASDDGQRPGAPAPGDSPFTSRRAVRATPHAFRKLWHTACGHHVSAQALDQVTRAVVTRYNEPWRRYHTLMHIDHCLGQLELARPLLDDATATELALWFHDVIYAPTGCDNEEKSAAFFSRAAQGSLPEALISRVVQLIEVTAHPSQPDATDECFVVDIDLSSFGRPWPEFLRDTLDVRCEAVHLSDPEFFARQVRFLEGQLARETFCHTEFFHQRHGRRALANIRRLLRIIRDGGGSHWHYPGRGENDGG